MMGKKLEEAVQPKRFSWSVTYMIRKANVLRYCPDRYKKSTTRLPIMCELNHELNLLNARQKIKK